MSEFDNVPPPPATTDVPADQRTMALAAHLLGIFTGFIGALIGAIILLVIYGLIKKK